MLSWIRNGVEYPLDTGQYSYRVEDANFGAPPIQRLTEVRALQHGVSDVGYRLGPRLIQLVLGLFGDSQEHMADLREALVEIFRPSDVPGSLRVVVGTRTRQIDAHLVEGLEYTSSDRKGMYQKTGLSLLCPDPTWYDPNGEALTISLGGGGEGTPVPTIIPMTVGASSADAVVSINYRGSAQSHPSLIRISGPISDPILYNDSTGRKLDFTGTTLGGGEWLDIDTRAGRQSVKDQNGADRIGSLTSLSDLATWVLEPISQIGGNNSIRLIGSGINSLSKLDLSYLNRYLGI